MAGKRQPLQIKNFNGFAVTEAIFNLAKDGEQWASKGLADTEPFVQYVRVEEWEVEGLEPEDQARYAEKKRRLVFDIHQALKLMGILDISEDTRTTNADYYATPVGLLVIRGYFLMKSLAEAGISHLEAIRKLLGAKENA